MYDFSDYGLRFEFQHYNSMDFGPYGVAATVNPSMNQVQGTNRAINWGVKNIELELLGVSSRTPGYSISPGTLGAPEREELIRLAKLNEVGLTVHAPIVSPDGFDGRRFSEPERKAAEMMFKQTIDIADQIGRKTGVSGIPVVIHSSERTPGNPVPEEQEYVYDVLSGEAGIVNKGLIKVSKEEAKRYNLLDHWDPSTGALDAEGARLWLNIRKMDNARVQLASLKHQLRILEQERDLAIRSARGVEEAREAAVEYQNMINSIRNEIERTNEELKRIEETKEVIIPLKKESLERTAETIKNVALYSFSKPTKPTIAVENVYPEMALGKPEDVAEVVKLAREKFVKELEKKGVHPADARAWADRIIGMTLDTGHMNIWRKYGYTEKDFKEWTKKVAPYVKHVHVTDNWGDQDAHLPVGWGNVPNKEVIGILRSYGFHGKLVAETPNPPDWGGETYGVAQTLYTLGAPILPSGPSWEEAAGSYFMTGYQFQSSSGPYPGGHVEMYGLGFTGLPFPLGGEKSTKFSKTPMS